MMEKGVKRERGREGRGLSSVKILNEMWTVECGHRRSVALLLLLHGGRWIFGPRKALPQFSLRAIIHASQLYLLYRSRVVCPHRDFTSKQWLLANWREQEMERQS